MPPPSRDGPPAAPTVGAVVGCARNVRRFLPNALAKMREIARQFESSSILVYENDSTDGTRQYLERQSDVRVIGDHLRGRRTERLAHARNALLRLALEEVGCDYLVVVDMDDVLETFDAAGGMRSSLEILRGGRFDAVGANSVPLYYDMWALRTVDGWMPGDCFAVGLRNRAKVIPATSGQAPVQVRSCFGGVAVYRAGALRGCAYRGVDEQGREVCEHVPLHLSMVERGARICINPQMVVKAPPQHVATILKQQRGAPPQEYAEGESGAGPV